jgi:hypothetical protein
VLDAGRPAKDRLLDSAGAGAAFLDYDKDGRLDVYLANGWRLEGAQVVERGKNALYHQRPTAPSKTSPIARGWVARDSGRRG